MPFAVRGRRLRRAGSGGDSPGGGPRRGDRPRRAGGQDVKVLQVQLEHPADGVYRLGDDASLDLAVSNTGTRADTLVGVRGPGFSGVRGADGRTGVAIDVPANDTVYIGAPGPPSITLVGLTRELRPARSTPVTFTFERAGDVTVDALVAVPRPATSETSEGPGPGASPSRPGRRGQLRPTRG